MTTRYQRYKADAVTSTTWLSQAAISSGYDHFDLKPTIDKPHTEPSSSSASTTETPVPLPAQVPVVGNRRDRREAAKKNEKAHKVAEKKQPEVAAVPSKASPDPEPKHYLVKTRDLIKQAEAIAASAKATIPNTINKVVEQAIQVRKRCSAWFQESGEVNGYSTEGHLFFIGVLERILEILVPVREGKTSEEAPGTSVESGGCLRDINNRFVNLEVEDMEDITSQDAKIAEEFALPSKTLLDPSASTSPPETVDTYELEHDGAADRMFLIFCFDDLRQTRTFLSRTWESYKAEQIDFITASFVTNGAFELIRKSEEVVLAALYPDPTEKLPKSSYFELIRGIPKSSMVWKEVVYFDVTERIFDMLSALRKQKKLGPVVDDIDQYFRGLWLNEVWETRDPTGTSLTQGVGCRDFYSQGRKHVFLGNGLPYWMVFASKILLDIYALGIDIESFTADMNSELKISFIRLQAKPVLGQDTPFVIHGEKWWADDRKPLDKMQNTIFTLNPFIAYPSLFTETGRMIKNAACHPIRTIYNPIFCGVKILELYIDREGAGIALDNYYPSLFVMAHLYNALRLYLPGIAHWVELEQVMKIHKRTLFGGDPPTTIKACINVLMMKPGMSINSSVSRVRRGQISPEEMRRQSKARKEKEYRPGYKYGPLLPHDKNAEILRGYFEKQTTFEQLLFQVQKMHDDSTRTSTQRQSNKYTEQRSLTQQLSLLQN